MKIDAGEKLYKPMQINCFLEEADDDHVKFRHSIIMEEGSAAEVMINYFNFSEEPRTIEDTMEIRVGEGASLEVVRMQIVNLSTRSTTLTTVQQAAGSSMSSHYVSLAGCNVTNSLKVNLCGEKATHQASGLSFTQQNEHTGNDIQINHIAHNCTSNQLFKHVLSDSSTGAFAGRITVNKDAPKTVAYQKSANILLDARAKMNIQPQLEIYADDVKCSHGATIGKLNEEALFYILTRGIGEKEAKKILLQAFAEEALNSISCVSFRENIRQRLILSLSSMR